MEASYYLQSRNVLWPREKEYFFEIRTNIKEVKFPHRHDFIELSLLAEGSLTYIVKEQPIRIEHGTLLFTRPCDIHTKIHTVPIKQLNLSFPENILGQIQAYLGEGFNVTALMEAPISPHVHLEKRDVKRIELTIQELLGMENKMHQEIKLKAIVFELLTKFFLDLNELQSASENDWLVQVMRLMEQRQNFTEGLPALLRISGRTHEHICRSMQKQFGTTPTKYINNLRLTYAENLLTHSDMDILSVSIEAGFNNLGYFYSLFQNRFAMSPKEYRKQFKALDQKIKG